METNTNTSGLWKQKFYDCLAIEFSDPSYFKVHHLLVITYMLQTDGYDPAYSHEAVKLLEGFLYKGVSPKQFIEFHQNSSDYNHGIENKQQRNLNRFDWEIDILSISTLDAAAYCQDVRNWAESVLQIIKSKPTEKSI
ncbi:hypothetical protein FHW36_11169 [Chitinophaga polysaccharea]|uniref:Uncharacterized protein n=1 Tax=Chitinophaga polysaccharea TaxID=1293035 RepID=A0A561P6Y5_9BACT|nr:DUF5946 family protein [Chitinophaga polysaccharea]TWF33879.1 hypothetical protein FHW36_11169 [Chitinophaga polysaccharea]